MVLRFEMIKGLELGNSLKNVLLFEDTAVQDLADNLCFHSSLINLFPSLQACTPASSSSS